MSQMRLARVRSRNEIRLRTRHRRGQKVRFLLAEDHAATGDRSGTDRKAAHYRKDRPVQEFYFEQDESEVRSVPGGEGWQGRLRISAARTKDEIQGTAAQGGFHRPDAPRRVSEMRRENL